MTSTKILWVAIAVLQTVTFGYEAMLVGLINERDDYALLGGSVEMVFGVVFIVLALLAYTTRQHLPRLQWWAVGASALTVVLFVYAIIAPPVAQPPLNNLLLIMGIELAKMIALSWLVLRSRSVPATID